MFSYSRNSIQFFKPLLLICSFFALTPLYDFNKRRLISRKLYLVYAILLKLVLLLSIAFWVAHEYAKRFENSMQKLFLAFDTIIVILGGVTALLVMTNSYRSIILWEELFQRFASLDCVINLNSDGQRERCFFKNAYVQFGLGSVLLISSVFIDSLFYNVSYKWSDTFRLISLTYNFLISVLIINLSTAVKCKFADVNKKLVRCKNAQFYHAVNITRKCRIIYQETGLIVEMINSLFGPALVFMYFSYGVQTLQISTTLLVNTKVKLHLPMEPSVVAVLYLAVLILALPVLTAICCDFAIKEKRRLVNTCHALQRPLDIFTKRHQELEDFADQINYKEISFFAFRCLQVDRKAIVLLLTVTSNYFVFIVQFLNNE